MINLAMKSLEVNNLTVKNLAAKKFGSENSWRRDSRIRKLRRHAFLVFRGSKCAAMPIP